MSDAETATDPWEWWTLALQGKAPPVKGEGTVHQGYFRTKSYEPVAFWQDAEGWVAKKGRGEAIGEADQVARLFKACAAFPITVDLYDAVLSGQPWPHEIKGLVAAAKPARGSIMGDNQPPTTVERITAEIADWSGVLATLVPIKDKAASDKVANIKDAIVALEKELKAAYEAETGPLNDALADVRSTFNPTREAAVKVKTECSIALTAFLTAERERAKAAAAAAQAAADAAGGGVTVKETKQSAGTGRKTVLKTFRSAVIDDIPACAAYFATMAQVPEDLTDVLRKLANRVLLAGVAVPGAHLHSEEKAV